MRGATQIEIGHHVKLLPFSNDRSNGGLFFIKLFGNCSVAFSNLVEVYNFVSGVLGQLFGLRHVTS